MAGSPAAKSVLVIGGGLAGIAAGCALADSGFRVTLLERRPFLGGRASSYEHPATGEVVDNCQHVLLGCCTNLLDLYRRFGAEGKIRWFDRLNFLEPGGRISEISPSFLPAPLHSAPSFLAASSLAIGDKLAISRAMLALMGKLPADTDEDFLSWLKRHGQTPGAIARFWNVVLVSALNEDLDRVSVRYGAQVFRESFLKSAAAGRMGIPTVPLTELYSTGADYIRARGGEVRLRASVESLNADESRATATLASGETLRADFAVVAIPHSSIAKLKITPDAIANKLGEDANHLESSPITGIHLWFDRQITQLEHAVLLDRTIQWMFHKSKLLSRHVENGDKPSHGSYVEVVVSASRSLIDKDKSEVVNLAVSELAEFFPAVKEAKLLKSAVIKEFHATYSALPRSDRFRPDTQTESPRLCVAGDWTATGWPATMEGAVRSGYIAAEAIAQSAGLPQRFLVADLPAQGLMRLFS